MAVAIRGGREAIAGVILHSDRGSNSGSRGRRNTAASRDTVADVAVRDAHAFRVVPRWCGFCRSAGSVRGRPVADRVAARSALDGAEHRKTMCTRRNTLMGDELVRPRAAAGSR